MLVCLGRHLHVHTEHATDQRVARSNFGGSTFRAFETGPARATWRALATSPKYVPTFTIARARTFANAVYLRDLHGFLSMASILRYVVARRSEVNALRVSLWRSALVVRRRAELCEMRDTVLSRVCVFP